MQERATSVSELLRSIPSGMVLFYFCVHGNKASEQLVLNVYLFICSKFCWIIKRTRAWVKLSSKFKRVIASSSP